MSVAPRKLRYCDTYNPDALLALRSVTTRIVRGGYVGASTSYPWTLHPGPTTLQGFTKILNGIWISWFWRRKRRKECGIRVSMRETMLQREAKSAVHMHDKIGEVRVDGFGRFWWMVWGRVFCKPKQWETWEMCRTVKPALEEVFPQNHIWFWSWFPFPPYLLLIGQSNNKLHCFYPNISADYIKL